MHEVNWSLTFAVSWRVLGAAVAACGGLFQPHVTAAEVEIPAAVRRTVDYTKDVEPIFRAHCAACHGAEKQESNFRVDIRKSLIEGGDFGEPAILEANSAESHLVKLVAGADPDFLMPPKGKPRLSNEQIGILRAWIDQGAKMPEEEVETQKLATKHWSFQKVLRPTPLHTGEAGVANPIDGFILEKLKASGLTMSSEADRATLIRRVYLDMLGLFPSPEEVKAFVNDESPDAYARLIDRVLDSPHYGERWARHWLDTVRFAESNGFETNYERPNAYRYRDWVINSLNTDLPYDKFVFAQLAGDTTGEDAATGFLVGGAFDTVRSPDPVLTSMQRQDELADMVNTTATAFLGLTVGCARCHSHKFDPILQKDFYALQAVFAGVQHGERQLAPRSDEKTRQRVEALAARIAKLQSELAKFEQTPFTGQTLLIDDEDAQRTSILVKEQGHGVNPAGRARGQKDDPGGIGRTPNVSGGRYTWFTNQPGTDVFAYRPQVEGRFRVWLSWGSGHGTHTKSANYVFDRDGDPLTQNDQVRIARVDQQRFSDGRGELRAQPLWSGFFDAGEHDFTAASAIILRGGEDGAAITTDVVVLQQAPAEENRQAAKLAVPQLLAPVNAKHNVERFPPVKARQLRFTIEATNAAQPCIDELEVWAAGENPQNVALNSAGAKVTSSGNYAGDPKHKLEHVNDGRFGNDYSWISDVSGSGWVQIDFPQTVLIDRVEWARDRQEKYIDRLATKYRIEVALEDGKWMTVASSNLRVPAELSGAEAAAFRLSGLAPEDAIKAQELIREEQSLKTEQQSLASEGMAYAGRFVQPATTYRLYRGDPMAKREAVAPDALVVMHEGVGSLELELNSSEQNRRVALAKWIISPDNPLTARVIVNRLWHFHFGQGIVATPSDFGAMGFRPSHPELLDWLASELVDNRWSLKHIHRLILLSNTYRQSNAPRSDALAKDGDAKLLWRFPPRRLEAEAIRDNILLTSGALDKRAGGPGFMLYLPNSNYSRNWVPKDEFGPAEYRRMVYALQLRMKRDAVFGAFDCPDGGQIAPARSRSTTPIQALNLFNSNFLNSQAEIFSTRVKNDTGDDPKWQVNRVFELAFGRAPSAAEVADAETLVREHGLVSLCRAIYNSNEFLFLP